MAFEILPDHVRHQRFAAGAFPRRLRAWRERSNLSQSEAALKLQISKRTLQEWGTRPGCATRLCANRHRNLPLFSDLFHSPWRQADPLGRSSVANQADCTRGTCPFSALRRKNTVSPHFWHWWGTNMRRSSRSYRP